MTPPTWLFVSYGGGHVQALLPVAMGVQALGIARPVYLALTTAAAVVRRAGLPVIGFRDVLGTCDARARMKGEELADQLAVKAAERDESVSYLGLSYADLEARIGEARAAEAFGRFGRQAFLPMSVLERVMDRVSPAVVVATNSPRAEQAAIEVARRRGIPCACLVDLLGLWERDLLARPDYADAVCVLNEGVRRGIVEAGRPPASVHVTGNPAFDSINEPGVVARGLEARRLAGWDGLRVLLYASSPEPREIPGVSGEGDPGLPRRIERELVELVRSDERLALWVRRHPSESAPDEIAALGHSRIRASGHDMPLHAALHASDEVVVTGSTVGVEANLAGKPVSQVRGSILDHLSPYVRLGIAQREVFAGGLEVLREPGPADALPVPQPTGRATERVIGVLRSLAGDRDA